MAHEVREFSETIIIMHGLEVDFAKLSNDVVLVSLELAKKLICEDKGTEKQQSVLGDCSGTVKRRVS
ncbi:hypothetical protein L9W92_01570 [Pelotomaculum terephthalicicum JT]|uniref:hypothetical protein n=1 Tax=Pelotomaculum TaxID=191373 RepID=UPI0009CF1EDF|nr:MULTISPECIES: hypothetical protein [Pelotomaculum]MCG9966746.1 hypothetical protein [Pelotomaculum terephthalicicum JT]OPX85565.1 MAG: hypothetical protein A4E54_02374 [Pelotomaculum sp. PtaB.Bin117]